MCVERERELEEKRVRERGKEMALETVVFPNDLFSYSCKELFSLSGGGGGGWSYDFGLKEEEESGFYGDHSFVGLLEKNIDQGLVDNNVFPCFSLLQSVSESHTNSSEGTCNNNSFLTQPPPPPPPPAAAASSSSTRKKRRRTKLNKNKEEVENQRMTHIVVERNRRKQMNEYLAILRSLMPASYVQRSDQASIIGGAINFVKELEQFLQSLEAQKEQSNTPPFTDFFAFPQYCSNSTQTNNGSNATKESMAENRSSIADIEVTMVESHANLKILSKRRPKQILKMVVGFQTLRLTILHLNVTTTVDQVVLYSFSVKVEDDCQLKSVDEIASAVHQMLQRIEDEAALMSSK